MRKGRNNKAEEKTQTATIINDVVSKLRQSGCLRDGDKTEAIVKYDGEITTVLATNRQQTLSHPAVLDMTDSEIRRQNDVARSYSVQKEAVAKLRKDSCTR